MARVKRRSVPHTNRVMIAWKYFGTRTGLANSAIRIQRTLCLVRECNTIGQKTNTQGLFLPLLSHSNYNLSEFESDDEVWAHLER
jgi:hypothetical protein